MKDRLSFMCFLGLSLSHGMPDSNTTRTFRGSVKKAGAVETLFARFDEALRAGGFLATRGQIVDAAIVAAPKQRNSKDQKQAIKEDRIPDACKGRPQEDGTKPVELAIPAFG